MNQTNEVDKHSYLIFKHGVYTEDDYLKAYNANSNDQEKLKEYIIKICHCETKGMIPKCTTKSPKFRDRQEAPMHGESL